MALQFINYLCRALFFVLLACSGTVFAAQPPDAFKEGDLIFGLYREPYADAPLSPAIKSANIVVAQVIKEFFSGLIPDVNGNELPNPDEYPIDQVTHKFGDSRFRFLVQGVGNLKVLSGPILYNSLQGGVGVEYDLITEHPDEDHQTLVALRVSPLYGEIAVIRMSSGGPQLDTPPTGVFLGSSFGLEAYKRVGIFQPGIRAYARPEIEVGGSKTSGVSLYGAVYCLIKLKDVDWAPGPDGAKATLRLRPEVSYFDRGGQQADYYHWGEGQGLDRTLGDIRRVYQAMLYLEIKY